MHDGVLSISKSSNSVLGSVLLCRDEIEVEFNMAENGQNQRRHLSILIDFHEGHDEEWFINSRKLDTVTFIFYLVDDIKKYRIDRNTYADHFLNTNNT